MKLFFYFTAFAVLAVVALLGTLVSTKLLTNWAAKDVAVVVGDTSITKAEVTEVLHGDLWRQGKTWAALSAAERTAAREQVLETLVTERLVRYYRENADRVTADDLETKSELATWRKQFEDVAEVPKRLALHQITERALEKAISAHQLDQKWIAHQIEGQIGAITVEEAKRWYSRNSETLRIPTAYHAAHIYLTRHDKAKPDRKAEMEAIFQKFISGAVTFADLAAKYSEDDRTKANGGDLGWFTAQRMPADFIAMVDRLRVGQVSPPALTALGWHIIELRERKDSTVPPLESVSAEIEAALRSQRQIEAVENLLSSLRRRANSEGLIHRSEGVIAGIAPAETGG